ncbi:GUstatory Receptor family [Aphelenchoides besseyi]|nr:GUstatory Receptor family [Aphelenchoides besseyi]
MFTNAHINGKFNSYVLVASWNIQASISLAFLVYWQWSEQLDVVICIVSKTKNKTAKAMVRRSMFFLVLIFAFEVLLVTEVMLLKWLTNSDSFVDYTIINPWRYKPLAVLTLILGFYSFAIFLLTFFAYMAATAVLWMELKELNNNLQLVLRTIEMTIEERKNRLHDLFMTHVLTVGRIRKVNQIFECFVLIIFTSLLPTLTFSILSFIIRARNSSIEVAVSIPEIISCILELLVITYFASNINSEAMRTESILCSDDHIWKNEDEELTALSKSFFIHAKQPHIGISLSGFVLVTKQLVFTALSISLTYVLFFVQTQLECIPHKRSLIGEEVENFDDILGNSSIEAY